MMLFHDLLKYHNNTKNHVINVIIEQHECRIAAEFFLADIFCSKINMVLKMKLRMNRERIDSSEVCLQLLFSFIDCYSMKTRLCYLAPSVVIFNPCHTSEFQYEIKEASNLIS